MLVRDLDLALAFYRDVLEFEVDRDMDHRSGEELSRLVGLPGVDARVVMLKGYGTRLELFKYHRPAGETPRPRRQCDFGLTHFALQVQGLQDLYRRRMSAGVDFNCPPQNLRSGVWAICLEDPEGVTVELVE